MAKTVQSESRGSLVFNPNDTEEVQAVIKEVVGTAQAYGYNLGYANGKEAQKFSKFAYISLGIIVGSIVTGGAFLISTSLKKKKE